MTNMATAQTHINKEWATTAGNPLALDWTNSTTNAANELISVGNTTTLTQGANILTTKYDKNGQLLWQQSYNTIGTNNDFGVALTTDASDNIFVVGTTDNGGFTNYDVVLLKYNAAGALIWSRTFNSPFSKNDIGTGIKVDDTGNIYLCGASEGQNTGTDYLIIKYNAAGTLEWTNRYDYAALSEIPIGIDTDVVGNLFVTGASASSTNNWDFTIAKYNAAGTFIGEARNALPGIGFDQPLAYKKDADGNIYLTGKGSTDGVNYNIKTIKFNPNFVLQWVKTIDFAGKEDVGNSIDIDGIGNIYIGGYTTKSNDKKEAFAVKYNANGNEVWRHEQSSTNTLGDASIKAIDVTPMGEVYFVGEEKGMNNTEDVIVSKISTLGKLEWQKKLTEAVDEKPASVNVSADGSVYITALKGGIGNTYETVKYTEFKTSGNLIYDATNGEPICNANQLVVRFQRSAINTNAVDDNIGTKKAEYGGIEYFLTPNALSDFNNALSPLCLPSSQNNSATLDNPCGIKAVKIFTDMKTTDTTTISRLGETIPIPDFWTALLLQFPDGMDIRDVDSLLRTIPDVVRYADLNCIISPLATCNDPDYSHQQSLHPVIYPNGHINVEEAWNYSTGSSFVKCGIFDSGIDWKHEDFNYDGRNANSSKVVDGWDFESNTNMRADVGDYFGHGTLCAGIIGAVRNNNIGIAGIAGGDADANPSNTGISLYSLRVLKENPSGLFSDPFFHRSNPDGASQLLYVYNAIVRSAMSNTLLDGTIIGYNYGLNIANFSWGYNSRLPKVFNDDNNNLIRDAIHFANRAKVTIVAARGNDGVDSPEIPATLNDDWILSVGGTGYNGRYKENDNTGTDWSPSFGLNIDVAAPCLGQMNQSTIIDYNNTGLNNNYASLTGTSASAAHVTGVVGLMMSYLNTPTPSYQNLAPEDCENIIQLSATDVGAPQYDQFTGYGRLDAGKAMRIIRRAGGSNPVLHFGNNSPTNSSVSTTLVNPLNPEAVVKLDANYTNLLGRTFQKGFYLVKKYRVDANVNHSISVANIRASWARPSSSNVLADIPDYFSSSATYYPNEQVRINSCDNTSCTMSGYAYEVFRLTAPLPLDSRDAIGWWPTNFVANPAIAQFEYSILTTTDYRTSVLDNSSDSKDISIYPNPSGAENTIKFNANGEQPFEINLFNIQGELIRQVTKGATTVGINQITSNIENLNAGIYIYEVKLNDTIAHGKFIKQ